jgi:hypothetical protein
LIVAAGKRAQEPRQLAEFAIPNDTAYLTPEDTMGGRGGYPGAIMGNFFGNHDQVRALTEAKQRGGGYERANGDGSHRLGSAVSVQRWETTKRVQRLQADRGSDPPAMTDP